MLQINEIYIRKIPILLLLIFLISSCSDQITKVKQPEDTKTSQSQLKLKEKLKLTSLFLQKVVTQPKARKELRYAIDYYSDFEVIDERVYLGAMFDANAAYRKSLTKKKGSSFLNAFAKAFKNSSIQGKAKVSNNYSSEELIEFLKQENIALYFPLS